jgi:hypothetical protein
MVVQARRSGFIALSGTGNVDGADLIKVSHVLNFRQTVFK